VRSARFKTFDAQVQGQSVGTATADQAAAQRMTELAGEAQSQLVLSAPTDGTVLTDDPALLKDENVAIGQPLIELAEGERIARVFIPTTAFDRISTNSEVVLAMPGQFSMIRLKLPRPDGEPATLPGGIVAKEKFQGIKMPVFYTARLVLPANRENPMYGLVGTVKIFGERRSMAGRVGMVLTDLMKAHVW